MEPFQLEIPQAVLDNLQLRLSLTRWPDEVNGAGWRYGTNREYLKQLVEYWQNAYDWRAQEARLNELPQFKANVIGSSVHFLHVQGRGPDPQPLLLTHGWPDSIFRFIKLIPMLTDPESFGGPAEDAFTVIAPSIPGFGFSDRPVEPGCDTKTTADLFATLMRDVLGYSRFIAHGGDFGASITEQLGLNDPDLLLGAHLNNVPPQHAREAKAEEMSLAEQAYLDHAKAWDKSEGAFTHLHSTKPQTLGAALNDSPVGLLAWILEKFQSWSDCDGDLERVYTKDDLLTNVMIYWVTETITSSMRFYYEKSKDQSTAANVCNSPDCFCIVRQGHRPRAKGVRGTILQCPALDGDSAADTLQLWKYRNYWQTTCASSAEIAEEVKRTACAASSYFVTVFVRVRSNDEQRATESDAGWADGTRRAPGADRAATHA